MGIWFLYKDGELRSAAAKTICDENSNGLLKFAKDKASGKIDLIVALGMSAMGSLEEAEEPTGGFLFSSPDPETRAQDLDMGRHLRQLYRGF